MEDGNIFWLLAPLAGRLWAGTPIQGVGRRGVLVLVPSSRESHPETDPASRSSLADPMQHVHRRMQSRNSLLCALRS